MPLRDFSTPPQTLVKISQLLPPEVRRLVRSILPQFLKFAVVGTIGFITDTATVYVIRDAIGIYAAGFAGSAASTSITWPLNRHWTFNGAGGAIRRLLPLYIATNLLTLALNRSVFIILVTFVPLCARQPIFAVAAGSIAGMFVNFFFKRSLVFRARA